MVCNWVNTAFNNETYIVQEPIAGEDFGILPNPLDLTWDHTTDIGTAEYPEQVSDTEDELSKIANEVVASVLNEDEENVVVNHRLELANESIIPGRVYELSNRLEAAQSLIHIPQSKDVMIKKKRLNKSVPVLDKSVQNLKEKEPTEKKDSKLQRFVKKLTVSRRPPEDKIDYPSNVQVRRSKREKKMGGKKEEAASTK